MSSFVYGFVVSFVVGFVYFLAKLMSRRFALFIDRYATRIAAVIDLVTGHDPKEAAAKYAATKRPMWKTVAPVDESYRIAVARALSCRFKYSNLNDEALIKIAKALPEGEASHIAREAGWNPDDLVLVGRKALSR